MIHELYCPSCDRLERCTIKPHTLTEAKVEIDGVKILCENCGTTFYFSDAFKMFTYLVEVFDYKLSNLSNS